MAQRQNLPVDPNNPYDAYQAVLQGEVVQRSLTLNGLFGEMKEWQRNRIIDDALQELCAAVGRLPVSTCPYANEANDFYQILKKTHAANSHSFENMRFAPSELVSLIRATLALVTTSPNLGGQVNPVFAERISAFDQLIKKYQRDRRDQLYDGISRLGNALVAAAFTALIVLLSIVTSFGLASAVAAGVGGYFLFRNVAHAVGHFSTAAKQNAVIHGMQPLVDKVNEQRQGLVV